VPQTVKNLLTLRVHSALTAHRLPS